MENNGESNSRSGSFRLGFGLGPNEAKVHTVVELGHTSLLQDGAGEDRQKEQKPLTNTLSPRQMKSLVALCDTILPSIDNIITGSEDESVAKFYRTSASMAETPDHVGLATFNL